MMLLVPCQHHTHTPKFRNIPTLPAFLPCSHPHQSESELQHTFEEASRRGPSIIIVEELETVAPAHNDRLGRVEKRLGGLLGDLLDTGGSGSSCGGRARGGAVVVLGTTNQLEGLEAALLAPTRFGKVVEIGAPDPTARHGILSTLCQGMQIAHGSVDEASDPLRQIAAGSHGFVAADLKGGLSP